MAALMSTGRFCIRCSSFQIVPTRLKQRSVNMYQRSIRPPKTKARRVFDLITQPIFVEEVTPRAIKCSQRRKAFEMEKTEVNPYEEFVFKQCKKLVFENNNMIIVCQALPVGQRVFTRRKNKIQKSGHGLNILKFSNKLMRRAVEGTKLENMTPWFMCSNVYIVSEENKLAEAMKLLRKIPEFIPLGGLVEDRLLTRQQLDEVTKLPNIEIMRGELVSILNQTAGEKTYRLLNSHQQTLSRNLEQFVKQSQEENSDNKDQSQGQES